MIRDPRKAAYDLEMAIYEMEGPHYTGSARNRGARTSTQVAQMDQWLNPDKVIANAPENINVRPEKNMPLRQAPGPNMNYPGAPGTKGVVNKWLQQGQMGRGFTRGLNNAAIGIGGFAKKNLSTELGGFGIGTAFYAASYWNDQKSFSDNLAQAGTKGALDSALDVGLYFGGRGAAAGALRATGGGMEKFATNNMMSKSASGKIKGMGKYLKGMKMQGMKGIVLGTAAVLAGSYLMDEGEITKPGAFAGKLIDKVGEEYHKERYGVKPITQNKRTMASIQKQLGLLGQSRPRTMMGQEAQLMHN